MRAMDTITTFVKSKKPEIEIIKFAVAGASKVRLRYDRILLYKCYA